jgi:hypothetical protein
LDQATPGELLARIRHLEDRVAIAELIRQIARGTDRFDTALLQDCIAADARIDMGTGETISGASFAAHLRPPAAPRPGRMHVVSNERIEIAADRACSETYIVSWQDQLVDGIRRTRVRAGRYLDRFERRDGRWLLNERIMVDEWGRIDPVADTAPQGKHLGQPAPEDASYAHFDAAR